MTATTSPSAEIRQGHARCRLVRAQPRGSSPAGVEVDQGDWRRPRSKARRAKYGSNTFAEAKKASKWQTFSRQYADPMQIVLLIAGIVCLFLPGQFFTGVLLILLTLVNAWMAMNQEGKAAVERLGAPAA